MVTAIATAVLNDWLATQPRAALRLLGVGVSDLSAAVQQDLFRAAGSSATSSSTRSSTTSARGSAGSP